MMGSIPEGLSPGVLRNRLDTALEAIDHEFRAIVEDCAR